MNKYDSNLRPGTVWRHVNGGRYIVERRVRVHIEAQTWVDGILYRDWGTRDPAFYVRTLRDFCDRFTEVVEG